MINNDPKDWSSFVFRFHKSDTIRTLLPLIIIMCLYAAIVAYVQTEYFHITEKSHVTNITIMHSLLGFVISMLLVFRTNTAYDRWWEGRKQWGALVNNSRGLAIKLSSILAPDDEHDRTFFRKTIPAFSYALKNHLRSEHTRTELFDDEYLKEIDHTKHVPNQLSSLINKRVQNMLRHGKITGEQLLYINHELQSLNDICGACERIKNTPIPYSYSAFLKKFIFVYVVTLPFGYVFSLGFYIIPVIAFIFYVLASLELIAEEIEDPFGNDANDLPLDRISQTIEKNVIELL
jgi:ion channel-forming bestrophin family protein